MKNQRLKQFSVLGGALVLLIVLYLAPRTPALSASGNDPDIDQQVAEALELVTNSPNPMQGIVTLREIANEHPDHITAQWYLGLFSLETGQFDKAEARLLKVIELDEEGLFPEAHVLMGGIHSRRGDYENALSSMQKGLDLVQDDTARANEVRELMQQLRTKRDSIN